MNVSSIFSLVERMMPISLHQLSNQCMRVNRPFWASVLWVGGSIECFNLALLFRISGSIWNRIWLVYNNLCISCYLEAPAMLAQCAHGLANTKTDEEQKRVCRCLCVIIPRVVECELYVCICWCTHLQYLCFFDCHVDIDVCFYSICTSLHVIIVNWLLMLIMHSAMSSELFTGYNAI